MNSKIKKIDMFILCGGRGERLKGLSKKNPKILLEVGGIPFIDILMGYFFQQGVKRFVLGLGHFKECIKKHFKDSNYNFVFSEEKYPLGTAGAIKKAELFIKSPSFFAANGDSICSVNLKAFYEFHIKKGGILSMVLIKSRRQEDYGVVKINGSKMIISFKEKASSSGESFINAGIYLIKKDMFRFIPENKKVSLEYDVIPRILDGGCYGYTVENELIDIGTPNRFRRARKFLLERKFI